MEKSNEKPIYGSLHYFEPINKYQTISFTDVKDLSLEKKTHRKYISNKQKSTQNNHK